MQEPAHLSEALPYQDKPPTNVEFVGTAPDALAPGETGDSVTNEASHVLPSNNLVGSDEAGQMREG